jgi:hypothetical protein
MINPSPTSVQPVKMEFQTVLACYLGRVQRGSSIHPPWQASPVTSPREGVVGTIDTLDWIPAKASPAAWWTLVQGPAPGKHLPKFQELGWWVSGWSFF